MTYAASRRPLLERGWRYTVVGLVCLLANYVAMLTVDFLGGHYLLGILVACLTVTPLGYALHSWFTFAEPFSRRAFVRFSASMIAAYPIATVMMIILCSGLHLSVAMAMPIATVGMFLWNFAAAHWAILRSFGPPRRPSKAFHMRKEVWK